ncbi:MAG: ferritin family protein [Acidobacteria bacterium]|nr:ferritin family protein [Acidobacteriota bacterium]
MDQGTRKVVLEAVKTAIITELRGFEIYRAAAERASDPSARQMFEALADDERQHKEFLEVNFKSLLDRGEWSVPATPENLSPLDHSDIITPAFLARVKGGAFEMAAIGAGAELERSAIAFYRKEGAQCPDPESAKVFQFLADWEVGHLETLVDLEKRMRDEYFADQGFSRM